MPGEKHSGLNFNRGDLIAPAKDAIFLRSEQDFSLNTTKFEWNKHDVGVVILVDNCVEETGEILLYVLTSDRAGWTDSWSAMLL